MVAHDAAAVQQGLLAESDVDKSLSRLFSLRMQLVRMSIGISVPFHQIVACMIILCSAEWTAGFVRAYHCVARNCFVYHVCPHMTPALCLTVQGMFDPADQQPYLQIPITEVDSDDHRALARQAARGAAVSTVYCVRLSS